jgi:uncharacterized protein YciI
MKTPKAINFFLFVLLLLHTHVFSQVATNQSSTLKKEIKMDNQINEFKEYILLVRLPLNYEPENAKEVREQWNTLLEKWKADGTYVTSFVYPNDGYLVTGSEKSVTREGVVSNNFKLVSNMILRAANYEAALELAKQCPVLKQGGMIEVREIQPRPKPNKPADTSAITKHNLYVVRYAHGKNYDLNKSIYKQDLLEHGKYMKQLLDEGKLLMAGPFTDNSGAEIVLKADNEQTANDIVSKDPAIIKNIFIYEIKAWDITFNKLKF